MIVSYLHTHTHYPKITGLAETEFCPGQASQERVLTSQYLPPCGKATPEDCHFIIVRADLWEACLLISAWEMGMTSARALAVTTGLLCSSGLICPTQKLQILRLLRKLWLCNGSFLLSRGPQRETVECDEEPPGQQLGDAGVTLGCPDDTKNSLH